MSGGIASADDADAVVALGAYATDQRMGRELLEAITGAAPVLRGAESPLLCKMSIGTERAETGLPEARAESLPGRGRIVV